MRMFSYLQADQLTEEQIAGKYDCYIVQSNFNG